MYTHSLPGSRVCLHTYFLHCYFLSHVLQWALIEVWIDNQPLMVSNLRYPLIWLLVKMCRQTLIQLFGGRTMQLSYPTGWAAAFRLVLLVQPSSAAAERAFSILQCCFNEKQRSSLEDYIELSIMLQFNHT